MSNVLNKFEQAGTGDDNKVTFGGTVQTGGKQNLKKVFLSCSLEDISTASTAYIPSPVAGKITAIKTVVDGPIAVADAIITAAVSGLNITNGATTISLATAVAGSIFLATPTDLNHIAVNDNVSFVTDGASTNTVKATIIIEITLS